MFADYEAWKKLIASKTADSEIVECPHCEGDGVICEDCCECGHESERECCECDGRGDIRFGDLCKHGLNIYFLLARYEEAVLEDFKYLSGWIGQFDAIGELAKINHTAYSKVSSHELQIRALV